MGKAGRGLACEKGDGLCRVDGGTAAESHDEVGTTGHEFNGALLHRFQRRIGLHAGKNAVRDVAPFQMAGDLVGETALDHERVRHHEGAGAGQFLQGIKGILAVTDLCFSVELGHADSPQNRSESFAHPAALRFRHALYSETLCPGRACPGIFPGKHASAQERLSDALIREGTQASSRMRGTETIRPLRDDGAGSFPLHCGGGE